MIGKQQAHPGQASFDRFLEFCGSMIDVTKVKAERDRMNKLRGDVNNRIDELTKAQSKADAAAKREQEMAASAAMSAEREEAAAKRKVTADSQHSARVAERDATLKADEKALADRIMAFGEEEKKLNADRAQVTLQMKNLADAMDELKTREAAVKASADRMKATAAAIM